jgi:hypothetical protein
MGMGVVYRVVYIALGIIKTTTDIHHHEVNFIGIEVRSVEKTLNINRLFFTIPELSTRSNTASISSLGMVLIFSSACIGTACNGKNHTDN